MLRQHPAGMQIQAYNQHHANVNAAMIAPQPHFSSPPLSHGRQAAGGRQQAMVVQSHSHFGSQAATMHAMSQVPSQLAMAATVNATNHRLSNSSAAAQASSMTISPSPASQLIELLLSSASAADVNHHYASILIAASAVQFLELSVDYLQRGGVSHMSQWLFAAFAAYQRDLGATLTQEGLAFAANVPFSLTTALLMHLLHSWYRLLCYHSHNAAPNSNDNTKISPIMQALYRHADPEIRELAGGIFQRLYNHSNGLIVAPQRVTTVEQINNEFQQLQRLASQTPGGLAQIAAMAQRSPPTNIYAVLQTGALTPRSVQHSEPQSMAVSQSQLSTKIRSLSNNQHPQSQSSVSSNYSRSPVQSVVSAANANQSPVFKSQITHSPASIITATATATVIPVPTPATATLAVAAPSGNANGDEYLTPASLVCPLCSHVSDTDMANYYHILDDHCEHLCSLCCLSFRSEDSVILHFESHTVLGETSEATHACGLCGLSFVTEASLDIHHASHCSTPKKTAKVWRRKRKIQTDDTNANAHSETGSALKNESAHVNEDDNDEVEGDEDESGGTRKGVSVPVCDDPTHLSGPIEFQCDADLQSHASQLHHTWHCFHPDCHHHCDSVEELTVHVAGHCAKISGVELLDDSPLSLFSLPPHCHYCGQPWTKKISRIEHLYRHRKPFLCSHCPMRFARKSRQRNHSKRKHKMLWESATITEKADKRTSVSGGEPKEKRLKTEKSPTVLDPSSEAVG